MIWHSWFRRKRWEERLDAELRFHIEQQIAEGIRSGLGAEEARRQVFLQFGGVDQIKEGCRDTRPLAFLESRVQDLRFAIRQLRKNPVFTTTVVLTLALGIGVITAIFSLVDQVLLRTLPVPRPEELVYLYHPGPVQGNSSYDEPDMPAFSYPMFRELQRSQTPFTGLAGARNHDSGVHTLIGDLAMIGLYGVLAYNVRRRTHEIGLRMALGAEPGGIVRMIVWQGVKLALVGIVIGLAAARALTRLIQNMLYGVSPTDPFTYVAVSIVLIGVAALASYIPARRAAHIDPMLALRAE
jgi:hypothetical protein